MGGGGGETGLKKKEKKAEVGKTKNNKNLKQELQLAF